MKTAETLTLFQLFRDQIRLLSLSHWWISGFFIFSFRRIVNVLKFKILILQSCLTRLPNQRILTIFIRKLVMVCVQHKLFFTQSSRQVEVRLWNIYLTKRLLVLAIVVIILCIMARRVKIILAVWNLIILLNYVVLWILFYVIFWTRAFFIYEIQNITSFTINFDSFHNTLTWCHIIILDNVFIMLLRILTGSSGDQLLVDVSFVITYVINQFFCPSLFAARKFILRFRRLL